MLHTPEEQSNVNIGTVIGTWANHEKLTLFVYEIKKLEDGSRFLKCIPLKELPESLAQTHSDWLYWKYILDYGAPLDVHDNKNIKVLRQIPAEQTAKIIEIQKYYFVHGKKPLYSPSIRSNNSGHQNQNAVMITSVDRYFVTDRITGRSDGICPVCNSKIYSKKYKVPIFDAEDAQQKETPVSLYHCSSCHHHFMNMRELEEQRKLLQKTPDRHRLKPENMETSWDGEAQAWLYTPIPSEHELFRER